MKRPKTLAVLMLMVLAILTVFIVFQNLSAPGLTADQATRTSIAATNSAVTLLISTAKPNPSETATLRPEVLASAEALNATNSARATKIWLDTVRTATAENNPAQTNVAVTPTFLVRRDDRDKIKSLFANPPSTLGGIPYEAYLKQSFSEPIGVSITNMGDTKYPIVIWFESSFQEAQRRTQGVTSRLPNAQQIEIGDEAYVAADAWKQGTIYLGVLRYRNVVVEIESPLRPATMTTVPHPLTNDQLAAVLKDIYEKILKKGVS